MMRPRAAEAMLQLRDASMLRCEGLVNRFGDGSQLADNRNEGVQQP
jgi:hypothetical protein